MGSILFLILKYAFDGQETNDYQILPILVSLDAIAMGLFMHHRAGQSKPD